MMNILKKLSAFILIAVVIFTGCRKSEGTSNASSQNTEQIAETSVTTIGCAMTNITENNVPITAPSETSVSESVNSPIETGAFTLDRLAPEVVDEVMKALDLVKEKVQPNYKKSMLDDRAYLYGDPKTFNILEFDSLNVEGDGRTSYLFHNYEIVEDDPTTGDGHTVTIGWYKVYKGENTIIDTVSGKAVE